MVWRTALNSKTVLWKSQKMKAPTTTSLGSLSSRGKYLNSKTHTSVYATLEIARCTPRIQRAKMVNSPVILSIRNKAKSRIMMEDQVKRTVNISMTRAGLTFCSASEIYKATLKRNRLRVRPSLSPGSQMLRSRSNNFRTNWTYRSRLTQKIVRKEVKAAVRLNRTALRSVTWWSSKNMLQSKNHKKAEHLLGRWRLRCQSIRETCLLIISNIKVMMCIHFHWVRQRIIRTSTSDITLMPIMS